MTRSIARGLSATAELLVILAFRTGSNHRTNRPSISSQPYGKKVGFVVTVTHEVRTVREIGEDDLRLFQRQWTPVPALMGEMNQLGRQSS